MSNEDLYKNLLNRQDLQDIPILYIVKVAFAVMDELTKGENNE